LQGRDGGGIWKGREEEGKRDRAADFAICLVAPQKPAW
jgi:hypothetical protein